MEHMVLDGLFGTSSDSDRESGFTEEVAQWDPSGHMPVEGATVFMEASLQFQPADFVTHSYNKLSLSPHPGSGFTLHILRRVAVS